MTRKERRIDEAIENLRGESDRCRKFISKHVKARDFIKAYESERYCEHIDWVLDQIEYYLEEGRL